VPFFVFFLSLLMETAYEFAKRYPFRDF
jgi:hypothetical protein